MEAEELLTTEQAAAMSSEASRTMWLRTFLCAWPGVPPRSGDPYGLLCAPADPDTLSPAVSH